ncbi:ankyrin repeat and LEM domain-containing protein 2 homolog [Malaya genurostris]|uniref:ankyrin repeat and LEM domain-containing protein 2 homolog n=1 Tax=Malaya genurostris TaxID=325434 RepID=UPI0026F3F5BA|nr:ankyrin repeat and LEM domain-containing protein 2 homolog [Malaya genurostris]
MRKTWSGVSKYLLDNKRENFVTMEYYAIYLPYKEPELSIKSFYNDKEEALKVLKSHKEARLKAFRTSEEAVYFYLNGPSDPLPTATPKSPTGTPSKLKVEKTPFKAPKSQELVAFRKLIEKNSLDLARDMIQQNPRYLVSSGDMPTILKEGPRYNALHVAAMEASTDMCKLILQTIEKPSFIEFLHGQRNPSTDEVSAILLDLYLNMPDKSRSETPLHFAAKFGAVGVVEVLISYPQCKMTRNTDGQLPKDIICTRAKIKNDTVEIRKAIGDLLQERFFVPVIRAVDNSTPPVVGEPFTLSNPPNLEAKDKFSPKLEIKAFAGPMDKEKAKVFCKRWKTPPRLIPSPRFISPVKAFSSSKIPISVCGGNTLSPLSSTPIANKRSGGRRSLFPNRSYELTPEQEEQEQRSNSINNNFDIEVVQEDVDLEELEEKRQQDEKNGNSLVAGIKPIGKTMGNFGIRMSPVKRSGDVGNFMFRRYRERLQNSFATIYDDDDDNVDAGNDTREGFNELEQEEKSIGNGDTNFSYFCDENNSFYEGTNITESPSFKERKLRLTDTEKGLEIIGRNLAEDHEVGWNEYWNFLGTFADLKSNDGLRLFENYLKQQRQPEYIDSGTPKDGLLHPKQFGIVLTESKANDSVGSICGAMERMHLRENLAKSSPLVNVAGMRHFQPSESTPIHSKITNPYLCLYNSLQVFAKRFVKNLDESSTAMTMDFAAFFQQAVVDCVRKLNTLVDNYRKDAAFGSIDFSKVHSRYAQLIVINIEQQKATAQGVIHRLKLLLDKSREVHSARKYPDLHDSLICLQNFLDFYILKKAELMADCGQSESQTETSCSRTWTENPLVHSCNCRIDGVYAKKGSMERLNKRREQRKKAIIFGSTSDQKQQQLGGTVFTLEDVKPVPSPAPATSTNFGSYRNPVTLIDDKSDDDDEEYFSCSDSELDTDSDGDDPDVSYETPPSSPSFFSQLQNTQDLSTISTDDGVASDEREEQFLDSNGDGDESDGTPFTNFIEGLEPSKQDVDVLNVVEKRVIDPEQYPFVHEWRNAMLKLPDGQRHSLSTKPSKMRWRVGSSHLDNTSAIADLSDADESPFGNASQAATPISSVSKLLRYRGGASVTVSGNNDDSLVSLDARISLMNISDFNAGQQRATPAPSS